MIFNLNKMKKVLYPSYSLSNWGFSMQQRRIMKIFSRLKVTISLFNCCSDIILKGTVVRRAYPWYLHSISLVSPFFIPWISILYFLNLHSLSLVSPFFIPGISILYSLYLHSLSLVSPFFIPCISILYSLYLHSLSLVSPFFISKISIGTLTSYKSSLKKSFLEEYSNFNCINRNCFSC